MKASAHSGGIAGIVAGAASITQAIMGLVKPQAKVLSGMPDYVLEVIFIIALVAAALALAGVNAFAQGRYHWAGTTSFVLAMTGTGLMTISPVGTLLAGRNSWGPVFLGGLLMALVGYVLLGIAGLVIKAFPAWLSLALLAFPLSIVLSGLAGGILLGLAWLGAGIFILRQ